MGNLVSSFAFMPPKPATYDGTLPCLTLPHGIPVVQYPENLSYEKTLLYSHGNAEDLGSVLPYIMFLADNLNVNVVSYDYTGYGLHSFPGIDGTSYPNEPNIQQNIGVVYCDYLLLVRKLNPKNIFLVGRSIGTGPTVHLASQLADDDRCPAGVILLSPMKSAMHVASQKLGKYCWFFDIFASINKIAKINRPTLIIHGSVDPVIPVDHGKELATKCTNLHKLVIVQGAGHNGKMITHGEETLESIRDLISSVRFE